MCLEDGSRGTVIDFFGVMFSRFFRVWIMWRISIFFYFIKCFNVCRLGVFGAWRFLWIFILLLFYARVVGIGEKLFGL